MGIFEKFFNSPFKQQDICIVCRLINEGFIELDIEQELFAFRFYWELRVTVNFFYWSYGIARYNI